MAASFLMRAGRQAFIAFGSLWYSGRTKDSSEYRNLITEEESIKEVKGGKERARDQRPGSSADAAA